MTGDLPQPVTAFPRIRSEDFARQSDWIVVLDNVGCMKACIGLAWLETTSYPSSEVWRESRMKEGPALSRLPKVDAFLVCSRTKTRQRR